jgi:hypothetical protein
MASGFHEYVRDRSAEVNICLLSVHLWNIRMLLEDALLFISGMQVTYSQLWQASSGVKATRLFSFCVCVFI